MVPPHPGGTKVLKSVVVTSHPPVKVNPSSHNENEAIASSSLEQLTRVILSGHIGITGGAPQLLIAVKVAVQRSVPLQSVASKTMVTVPPVNRGGLKVDRSVDEVMAHPFSVTMKACK